MASVSAGIKVEKPSFAKIAAAGLKPPSAQQHPTLTDNTQKHEITSSPRDGTNLVSPSNGSNPSAFTPKQKKLVPLMLKDLKETGDGGTNGPQVNVQTVESISPPGKVPRALDGMLMPATSDEAGTQVSSSSGSAKPPSLDGKSVASGTTFALDEKESLRPDDSASVKAREDEDAVSPPGSGLPGSHAGSDDGVCAFHDQLREISRMDPSREASSSQSFSRGVNPPQGSLYIPPQGSGVGTVPGPAKVTSIPSQVIELPPDPKLLEAFDSPKDRIMVLKLEQDIVDFVKDAKESSLKLPQTNAFYRMLAHKLADYYMLDHVVDESTMAVRIFKTPHCRLAPPLTGIATPSTAASTPPPLGAQMKILRRGVDNAVPAIANGSNVPSKATSENGESGNDEDKKPKQPASREEREARYEAARKRIMGSAKPSEYPEEPVENDISRSSSAAGKKTTRKKQRADSDDDFEARSAYSPYYPTPFTSGGPTQPSYGFPNIVDSQSHPFSPPAFGNNEAAAARYQQYGVPPNNSWPNQGFHGHDNTAHWIQNQQPGYDLPGEFQRAMSFQPAQVPMQTSNLQHGFNPPYNQQFGGPQQNWPPQQNAYVQSYPSQTGPSFMQGYPNRPPSANQFQDAQPYAYGQLPSQAFPGRPPNKLEHPLPGSYKSKHFNPQSQSFVPGQISGTGMASFPPQPAPVNQSVYGGGYGMPNSLPRQNSTPAQNTMFGSPHQVSPPAAPARVPSQPMTHPLPQPVFPRQPSPNVPLPPKPEATPPKPNQNNGPAIVSSNAPTNNQSSIAKWGTPASLPAKPPPSVEPFDPGKFAQTPRQPSGSARVPGAMPSFGSMPPVAGGLGMTGSGVQSSRRP